jgi:hypothetical protein
MIGWPHRLKGISGGERKRLAFASEVNYGIAVNFFANESFYIFFMYI